MATLEPGQELPTLTVTPDAYLTVRYAGASGDFNPIHIDEDFARSVGLPGRILHGLWPWRRSRARRRRLRAIPPRCGPWRSSSAGWDGRARRSR